MRGEGVTASIQPFDKPTKKTNRTDQRQQRQQQQQQQQQPLHVAVSQLLSGIYDKLYDILYPKGFAQFACNVLQDPNCRGPLRVKESLAGESIIINRNEMFG